MPSFQPTDIEVIRDSHVRIRWSDGVSTTIPVETLRRSCPCAACRDARQQLARDKNPLRVLPQAVSVAQQRTIADAQLVGRYALQIRWSDGHDTGIFDYELLRKLGSPSGEPAEKPGVNPLGGQIVRDSSMLVR